jgi:hypothetical protein
MYFLPKIHKPDNPGRPPVFSIVLWHPWSRTYRPISRIPSMLSRFSRTFIFIALTNSFSPWTSNPYTL